MSSKYLFPNRFKKIGLALFIPAFIIGSMMMFRTFPEVNYVAVKNISATELHTHTYDLGHTIIGIVLILSALFIGFSKEKVEDEFIAQTRLESLLWATYINYALLIVCFISFWDSDFLNVMVYNMFSFLIIFIVRFNFILFINNRKLKNEKSN